MEGIRYLLIGVAILIILYNLIISFSNLMKIVSYCFKTGSISEYWGMYFESSFTIRAIISSLVGLVFAIIIFIIIAPILLIKGGDIRRKREEIINEGRVFLYEDIHVGEGVFKTNFSRATGMELKEIKSVGEFKIDAMIILNEISSLYKEKGITHKLDAMKEVVLNGDKSAVIPVYFEGNGKKYPIYVIYNQKHKEQFNKIETTLMSNGYDRAIYFSAID